MNIWERDTNRVQIGLGQFVCLSERDEKIMQSNHIFHGDSYSIRVYGDIWAQNYGVLDIVVASNKAVHISYLNSSLAYSQG